jgi:integrase/recombinase XerC
MSAATPLRSYAKANRELAAAFERYLVARGQPQTTIRAYKAPVLTLIESLGATSIAEVDRARIRLLLADLYQKGLDSNTIRLRTIALRAFFKFIRLTGLTKHDPTLGLAHRKIPGRLQRVLTIEEVERLIAASRDPFERAVAEVFYSTGVRVSELVRLRIEDIDFADGRLGSIRVKSGKGQKDRVVLFGSKAAKAMRDYLAWRPSQAGFLFEAPARSGSIFVHRKCWNARFYAGSVQHEISIGRVQDFPTPAQARREFDRIAAQVPGYRVTPARPYTTKAIGNALHRLAHRASLGRVHPHALRRAMACHMLVSGANLRAIQDLLGHEKLTTTMLYTSLTAENLKAVHQRTHPHEQREQANAEKK